MEPTSSPIKKGDPKVIRGWVMYDWANSVYQMTIASVIFPIYYEEMTRVGTSHTVSFFGIPIINSVLYSWSIAFAYLFVGFLSPIVSSMADYTGRRKMFMKTFTWLGALGCASLFFFDRSTIEVGILGFTIGTIGYAASLVFYNSFLPVIAFPEQQDTVSARGYAMGYLGGVVLLVLNLVVVMQPKLFGITDPNLPAKLSFLSVGLWWIGFSRITFKRLPRFTFGHRKPGTSVFFGGYQELRSVFRQVKRMPKLRIFLVGYFFTMMGLLAVMFLAPLYGKKQLQLENEVLIGTMIIIQFIGMGGAWLFAWLSGKIGNIRAYIVSIAGWVFVCIYAYYIRGAVGFFIAGIFVGLTMGGSQALARSTYSKMLPETEDHTSFFSFFDVTEKLATVGGTFSFGIIETLTGSMRSSILSVVLFFAIGLGFMLWLLKKDLSDRKPLLSVAPVV
jgi:UMF1 family MFS transporter